MKIKLLLLLSLIGLFSNLSAQVCKISESGDNVEVFSASIVMDNQVNIIVGNDSQDISANITVQVKVNYANSKTKTFTGKKTARPNAETIIEIPIDPTYGNGSSAKPISVEVVGISGTKCR